MKVTFIAAALACASSVSAITIKFANNCPHPVWAAIGQAPNGVPATTNAHGVKLAAKGASMPTASFSVPDTALGIRAWGRTGCDANGANCATGACNGGLVCTDAGITSNAIVSEYGYANFGAQYGGERTSWDISHVGLSINIGTRVTSSDGQSVTCSPTAGCAADQAYNTPTDYAADRNSPLGQTYTHTFCPLL